MTIATKKKLWQAQFLSTTDTALYDAPENAHCQVVKVVLVNTDASARTATIYHNIASVLGNDVNALELSFSVEAGESKTVTTMTGIILNPQDRIVMSADAAGVVTAHGYGVELQQ